MLRVCSALNTLEPLGNLTVSLPRSPTLNMPSLLTNPPVCIPCSPVGSNCLPLEYFLSHCAFPADSDDFFLPNPNHLPTLLSANERQIPDITPAIIPSIIVHIPTIKFSINLTILPKISTTKILIAALTSPLKIALNKLNIPIIIPITFIAAALKYLNDPTKYLRITGQPFLMIAARIVTATTIINPYIKNVPNPAIVIVKNLLIIGIIFPTPLNTLSLSLPACPIIPRLSSGSVPIALNI